MILIDTSPQLFEFKAKRDRATKILGFIGNVIVMLELFLIFRAWWVLLAAVVIHGIGMLACLEEPRIFDLWITRVRNCPRIKNHAIWKCNSYRP